MRKSMWVVVSVLSVAIAFSPIARATRQGHAERCSVTAGDLSSYSFSNRSFS